MVHFSELWPRVEFGNHAQARAYLKEFQQFEGSEGAMFRHKRRFPQDCDP